MPVHLLISGSCIAHVENVAQDFVAVEAEAEGAEGQEELFQELEVAEPAEELVLEANFTNSVSQQGKHRIHLTQSLLHKSIYAIFTYAFKLIGVVWYIDAWGRIVFINSLIFPDN